MSRVSVRSLRPLPRLLALTLPVALTGCAFAPRAAAMPDTPTAAASRPSADRTAVRGHGAELQVSFDWDPDAQALTVRYALRNVGAQPLMVFDRGDRQAVLTGRLDTGAVPPPGVETTGEGDVTLSHRAWPLPQPAPTVPPVPLASRVEPGATLDGTFRYAALTETPRRLRWCLGVMPFDPATFTAQAGSRQPGVWRGSFAAARRQGLLCTPWFDIAQARFEHA